MNTLLHKHLFTHISTELVSELEVPALTILDNEIDPTVTGYNLLNVTTMYVYTIPDVDEPPRYTLQFNTTDMNYITMVLTDATKLVPMYELQIKRLGEKSNDISFDLIPINVVKKEYYLPHIKDHYSLPDIEKLLEPEFFKFFTYASIHCDKLFDEQRALFRISYSSPEDVDLYHSLVSDMAGFKEAVLKFADKFEPECGIITETGFPYYAVTVPLDFNKVVDYFNIRIVD